MRKIAIYTGNRAEYGLQFPIIKAVTEHPELADYLLISGAHLDDDFGKTRAEIEKDGFRIHREIPIEMGDDTVFGTARAIGSGVLNLSVALQELRPDVLVVYADRFEGFAAVIAGTQMNIPTAHIEGGDVTEGGALDDSVRHAMTKLSHIHFTTNEEAAERVRRMGEESWRVFNVGFPAIDLIEQGNFATPAEIEDRFGVTREAPFIVFTQHSVTTEFELAVKQVEAGLQALERLAEDGIKVILTYPNNDAGGRAIVNRIVEWYGQGRENVQLHRSVGRYAYHGLLHLGGNGGGNGVCVGNSSSGIKETPALGCPAVNIGSRQQKRLRGENVLDVDYKAAEIEAAIRRCLEDDELRRRAREGHNPYGKGGAGKKIAEVLATISLDSNLLRKRMTL